MGSNCRLANQVREEVTFPSTLKSLGSKGEPREERASGKNLNRIKGLGVKLEKEEMNCGNFSPA